MTKIWAESFWKVAPACDNPPRPLTRATEWTLLAPIILLATLTVGMGLATEPLLLLANQAAAQLLDPSAYVSAVLGPEAAALVPPTQ